jgi:sugar (pentulose or hexulose) kinase
MSRFIGLDIGTTNWKAGLFEQDGTLIKKKTIKADLRYDANNSPYYDVELLWESILLLLKGVLEDSGDVKVIGITGMAEAGLLVERNTGRPLTGIIPWFFRGTVSQAKKLDESIDPIDRFIKTGLHNSYKYGISKLAWIKENLFKDFKGIIWLSVPDFVAFKLTHNFGTDYTLAARTFCFDINKNKWDDEFLEKQGFSSTVFPDARPSGSVIGTVSRKKLIADEHDNNISVAVSGHDHICASVAVGALTENDVFLSLGTAAVLLGNSKSRTLGEAEFKTGLSYGPHVIEGRMSWLGSIQMAGGTMEWLRKLLDDNVLPYDKLDGFLAQTEEKPTGILYYPYLVGSGVPMLDINAKAAFIGLQDNHGKGDILRGALEGIAYEIKWIKNLSYEVHGGKVNHIMALGGGTKTYGFMQILSNVLNEKIAIPFMKESSLAGAACIAAKGAGFLPDFSGLKCLKEYERVYSPHEIYTKQYERIFENGYMKLQKPLRDFFNSK